MHVHYMVDIRTAMVLVLTAHLSDQRVMMLKGTFK